MPVTLTHNAWSLAVAAECASPDTLESPGAAFLLSVQDAVNDYDECPDDDAIHEIADGAPDVYTHKRWQEFVDLAAYSEDLSEWGPIDPDDLERAVAGVALYQIAERLARALIEERWPNGDEDDDQDDDQE